MKYLASFGKSAVSAVQPCQPLEAEISFLRTITSEESMNARARTISDERTKMISRDL